MADKNLNDLNNDLTTMVSDLQGLIFDSTRMRIFANYLVLEIQQRVELGDGLSSMGGTPLPFKPLKESTIQVRQVLEKKGLLDRRTTPETSNQIATGTMIDSLDIELTPTGFNILITDPSRQEVYIKQEDMGRPWLYLTESELKEVDDYVEEKIDTILGNLFTKK